MPDLSYPEQRQIIDDFAELVWRYELGGSLQPSLVLEKLLVIEKLPVLTESLDEFGLSYNLASNLIDLLKYISKEETAIVVKGADLLVKLLDQSSDKNKGIFCEIWFYSRASYIENLLRVHGWIFPFDVQNNNYLYYGFYAALKFGHLEWQEEFLANFANIPFADTPGFFANALVDNDAEMCQAARLLFQRLAPDQKQQILEASVRSASCATPTHVQFLAAQGFYSPTNLKASIMLALLDERFFDRQEERSATIRVLVDLLTEPDFARQAEAILRNLRTKAGQTNLCYLFLFEENTQAERLALEAGYEPQNPAHRAAFLFLTGQFARYDGFDFDYSKLRGFYEAASANLRQRIAQMVKQSGNPAYFAILSLEQTSPEVADSHNQVVVQVLGDTANWVGLWRKVLELSFRGSVVALGEVLKSGWQPQPPDENQLYQKLAGLARAELADTYALKPLLSAKGHKLLLKPFSVATAHDWSTSRLLAADNSKFAAPVQNSLAYIYEILHFRFRHAIEIEAAPEIEPTKTDIEL